MVGGITSMERFGDRINFRSIFPIFVRIGMFQAVGPIKLLFKAYFWLRGELKNVLYVSIIYNLDRFF